MWKVDRPRRVTVGDEIRTIMSQAQNFSVISTVFPEEAPAVSVDELQLVDGVELRQRLAKCLPVQSLLDWLRAEYASLIAIHDD